MGTAMVWITAIGRYLPQQTAVGGGGDIAGGILPQRCCQVRRVSQLLKL